MSGKTWKVVGGSEKGGILVREGKDTTSSMVPDRLATGAVVKELTLEGERLQYECISGKGPSTGWVSIKLKDKVLMEAIGFANPASASVDALSKPQPSSLRFLFTRHGEAAHNPLINAGRKAEGRAILDPRLTERGVEQANAFRDKLKELVPDLALVITSPLMRALQTTLQVFGADKGAQVIVTPLHTETGILVDGESVPGQPCQRGSALEELKPKFPAHWDWSGIEDPEAWTTAALSGIAVHGPTQDGYFHPQTSEARQEIFRAWLRENTSACSGAVIIVGHSGFLKDFLGGSMMKNCELLEKNDF